MTQRRQTVAAVQMHATIGDIAGNIAQACDLAERALRAGATIVALPEFFTTPIILDQRLNRCSLPASNPALDMLRTLSRDYGAMIGGSYLEYDAGDVFNSYMLVSPDGTIHRHRKDLPTMAECAYYVGGSDEGMFEVGNSNIGVAVCWETIRSATVRRLRGGCDLVMSGSHWWSAPEWWLLGPYWRYHARLNADHMYRAPGRFARMVGAPMLHAAHCGTLEGRYALTAGMSLPVRTHLVGEAQIVDAAGRILARRTKEEGAGHILAEIDIGRVTPLEEVPARFWLERLPPFVRLMWASQNRACRDVYRQAKSQGKIRPAKLAQRPRPATDARPRRSIG